MKVSDSVSPLPPVIYSSSGYHDFDEETLLQIARFANSLRSMLLRRNDLIGFRGFRDPTSALLLEALSAFIEGRKLSVSSLCLASGAPISTALRTIKQLELRGILRREDDHKDLRRIWIAVDPIAVRPLIDTLLEVVRIAGNVRPGG